MSNELITSPLGEIRFLALRNKVKKKPNDTEATVFAVRLEFDGTKKENLEFKKKLEAINSAIIGTKSAAPGNFTVQASSKYDVKVIDNLGNQLDKAEYPSFPKGSSGTASIVIKPYTGNKLGGSINLVAVGLGELQLAEFEKKDSSFLNDLRNAIKSA